MSDGRRPEKLARRVFSEEAEQLCCEAVFSEEAEQLCCEARPKAVRRTARSKWHKGRLTKGGMLQTKTLEGFEIYFTGSSPVVESK